MFTDSMTWGILACIAFVVLFVVARLYDAVVYHK